MQKDNNDHINTCKAQRKKKVKKKEKEKVIQNTALPPLACLSTIPLI
jgi:hypothetical protein